MAPALFIPLGERCGHVHLFDDVAPAHTGVVSAEGYFAFLRRVWNDALLGPAEIVVEQILEPHAGDKQEVPAIFTALVDVFHGSVASYLAITAGLRRLTHAETLVKLRHQVRQLEMSRSFERIVIPQQRKCYTKYRKK